MTKKYILINTIWILMEERNEWQNKEMSYDIKKWVTKWRNEWQNEEMSRHLFSIGFFIKEKRFIGLINYLFYFDEERKL